MLAIKGAGGEHLQHYGKRWIPLCIGGFDALIEFEVADVQKPILSVSELARKGNSVTLEANGGMLTGPRGQQANLVRKKGLCMAEARPKSPEATKSVLTIDRLAPPEEDLFENAGGKQDELQSLPGPTLPTMKDQEEHNLTLAIFAPWCRHCVKAKAHDDPHHKLDP